MLNYDTLEPKFDKEKERKIRHRKAQQKKEKLHAKISLIKETEMLKNAEKLYNKEQLKLVLRLATPKHVSIIL